ncbi:MAG: hypothetical protein KKF39_02160 [Nanoarchaeota archaeon]|nr:hypothetical protein [Nanoarchaeota archaeon]
MQPPQEQLIEEPAPQEDENKDKTKVKIVRAILLFSAIIIAIVTIYTTIQLFSNKDLDVSFSPPNTPSFDEIHEENQEEGKKVSFDIDHEDGKEFEREPGGEDSEETHEYKSGPIPDLPPKYDYKSIISPLIIFEELASLDNNLIIALVLMEIVAIIIVYRRLYKRLVKKY